MKKAAAVIIYQDSQILSGINGAYSHETLNTQQQIEFIKLLNTMTDLKFLNQQNSIDYKLIPKVYQDLDFKNRNTIYDFFKKNTKFNIKQSHNGMFISQVNNKLDIIKGNEELNDEQDVYKTIAREISEEVKFIKDTNILEDTYVNQMIYTYLSGKNYPIKKIGKVGNKNYKIVLIKKEDLENLLDAKIILSHTNPEDPNRTELFDLQFRQINLKYHGYEWNKVVKHFLKKIKNTNTFNDYSFSIPKEI
ncbi:hypothetical protein CPAV1605_1516 [seawater metagenome]|uniref:Uncharacterized protein n=1 Tax=seawater metagenome TaxID=1561972 RepID=A0A5E8CMK6_9ZZZZ